jgi:heptosyltransferase-2
VAFVDRREQEHMVAYYWKLVEAVGGPPLPVAGRLAAAPAGTPGILAGDDRTRPRLCPTPAMLREASALRARRGLQDRPYVAVAPGAGYGPAKEWPVEHFGELCRQLVDRRRLAVVLLGTGADRGRCAALRRLEPSLDPFLVDLSGQTSVGALVGLIAGARAFVGNDSGPAHVAAALGTPGVVVFGSTSLVHSGPLSPSLRTVHRHLPCSPCFEKVCPLGHLDCLRGIPPGDVRERLDEGLDRSR